MFDKELVLEILLQIKYALEKIAARFEPVKSVDDFLVTPEGAEKLDSICMLLIAIGESLKNVDKITAGALFENYPEIEWKGIKGIRDIISHHYFDVDAEQIYWICEKEIEKVKRVVEYMINDLRNV
jgi:uncharacterized protein with HEPN domain